MAQFCMIGAVVCDPGPDLPMHNAVLIFFVILTNIATVSTLEALFFIVSLHRPANPEQVNELESTENYPHGWYTWVASGVFL